MGSRWFLLINGGDNHFDSLQNSICELEIIWKTFLSKDLVSKDRIKLLNARNENLFGDEATLKLITPDLISSILEGKFPISDGKESIRISKSDTVVIFFAGHGKGPIDWKVIPPSASDYDKLGSWMFYPDFKSVPVLFTPLQWRGVKTEARIIVFSLACYSGNLFRQCFVDNNNCLAVCFATQDYPASFDQLMGKGVCSFFEQENVKNAKLSDLCEKLQVSIVENESVMTKKSENLSQTEFEYEKERIESKEFAIGELECYEPRKIPSELWEIFREFDRMRSTIDELKSAKIASEVVRKLENHLEFLNWRRFDLMRMYKHKPNNRIQICGNLDILHTVEIGELFDVTT